MPKLYRRLLLGSKILTCNYPKEKRNSEKYWFLKYRLHLARKYMDIFSVYSRIYPDFNQEVFIRNSYEMCDYKEIIQDGKRIGINSTLTTDTYLKHLKRNALNTINENTSELIIEWLNKKLQEYEK